MRRLLRLVADRAVGNLDQAAAVVAAPDAAPCGVSMSTMPLPMVRMMRQPPE